MNKPLIRREGRAVPLDRHRLRAERMRAGLNQRRLAELAGVSQQLVSSLECGDCGASPDTLVRLAAALRCDAGDLMTRRAA